MIREEPQQNDIPPSHQYQKIETLIISQNRSRCQISKKQLETINEFKKQIKFKYFPNISQILQQKRTLTSVLLKKHERQLQRSQKIYQSAEAILLLKTGQYCIQDKNTYLIFSQFSLSLLTSNFSSPPSYYGFRYKFDKYAYYGGFCVLGNHILFHGRDGEILERREKENQGNRRQFLFMKGDWGHGEIVKGIREIYDDRIEKDKLIESYNGEFVGMRYEGTGCLWRKKDKNQFEQEKGVFKAGKFIKPPQQQNQ